MKKQLTPTQAQAFDRGRTLGCAPGGRAVITRTPPDTCPRCGRSYTGKKWHAWLGHLGLHKIADRYFDGDIQAAQKRLRDNGRLTPDLEVPF